MVHMWEPRVCKLTPHRQHVGHELYSSAFVYFPLETFRREVSYVIVPKNRLILLALGMEGVFIFV